MPPNLKRLIKEEKEMRNEPPAGCSAGPLNNDDMTKWIATIEGPVGTPYEGGHFKLEIEFPSDYPFKPPQIKFITKIFHPNIGTDGNVCLDILKKEWSPILTISKVLLSISSLLGDPNPSDPLNAEAAKCLKEDKALYEKKVKDMI